MSGALPKLIAVVGTNASGKSSLAISLARSLGGEVISADLLMCDKEVIEV